MERYSLINEAKHHSFKEGDIVRFEMPSFTSGEYLAKVYKDKDFGFYIDKGHSWFHSCRDWSVHNINDAECMDWLKEEYEDL